VAADALGLSDDTRHRLENDLNLLRLQGINLENRQRQLFAHYARHNQKLNQRYQRLNEAFI
jgi:hypothetical protein